VWQTKGQEDTNHGIGFNLGKPATFHIRGCQFSFVYLYTFFRFEKQLPNSDPVKMKGKPITWIYQFIITGLIIMYLYNCDRDNQNNHEKVYPITFNPGIQYGQLTDLDGNAYKTVTIDTQTWMAENLKTTKYSDGTEIPLLTSNSEWINNTPGYCWYENNSGIYKNTYGALYKWYTINTGHLCPAGWHVPSDSEWLALINYTGSELYAGRNLKEAGTTHWLCPEYGGDNNYGFTALPGGWRESGGQFVLIGIDGIFWTSSAKDDKTAYDRVIYSCYEDIPQDWAPENFGFSVRCVKD